MMARRDTLTPSLFDGMDEGAVATPQPLSVVYDSPPIANATVVSTDPGPNLLAGVGAFAPASERAAPPPIDVLREWGLSRALITATPLVSGGWEASYRFSIFQVCEGRDVVADRYGTSEEALTAARGRLLPLLEAAALRGEPGLNQVSLNEARTLHNHHGGTFLPKLTGDEPLLRPVAEALSGATLANSEEDVPTTPEWPVPNEKGGYDPALGESEEWRILDPAAFGRVTVLQIAPGRWIYGEACSVGPDSYTSPFTDRIASFDPERDRAAKASAEAARERGRAVLLGWLRGYAILHAGHASNRAGYLASAALYREIRRSLGMVDDAPEGGWRPPNEAIPTPENAVPLREAA